MFLTFLFRKPVLIALGAALLIAAFTALLWRNEVLANKAHNAEAQVNALEETLATERAWHQATITELANVGELKTELEEQNKAIRKMINETEISNACVNSDPIRILIDSLRERNQDN